MNAIADGELNAGDGAIAFQSMEPTATELPSKPSSLSARSTRLLISLCCILVLSLVVPFTVLGVPASPSFLTVAFNSFALMSPFASTPTALLPLIGVCLSGMEDGNRIPGRPGTDYAIPTVSEYQYFHSSAASTPFLHPLPPRPSY